MVPPATRIVEINGAHIRFAPSQPTGVHSHPVAVVGTVTEGSFVFEVQGQPMRLLRQGDAFYEPAGARILRFDNASATEPASITAFYLVDDVRKPLITMLSDADAGRAPGADNYHRRP